MIPEFKDGSGYLPPGEHLASWEEIVDRFGWNAHRSHLLEGLLRMAINLRDAGCTFLLLDGSFVTAKEFPGDFDACCDFSGIHMGRIDIDLFDSREMQKLKYFGELHPEQYMADAVYTYREFFQSDRSGNAKGIIRVRMETLP